jgi:lipid A 4'-phosphatase
MSLIPSGQQDSPISRQGAYSMLCVAGSAGLLAALVFSAFPGIDLAVSQLFHLGGGKFLFARSGTGDAVRNLLLLLFGLACAAAVVGFVMIAFFSRRLMGLGLAAWAFIALCALVGPGLVANLGFKDHWGRARPVHVTQFGGTKQFTPPLLRTDQCDRNCSFVSGEAANFFMLGFAIALLAEPARRRKLFIAAIAAGSFAGLLRIGAGAHFLSDVVFAGIFMAFVARGLAWLMFERFAAHLADDGPLHQSSLRAGQATAIGARKAWEVTRDRSEKLSARARTKLRRKNEGN